MRSPAAPSPRALLEETLVDAEKMIGTFNALLEIARAEAGSDRTAFEPVALAALTHDLAELYAPLAEDRQLPSRALPARHRGPGQPPSAGAGDGQPARQRDQVHPAGRPGALEIESAAGGPDHGSPTAGPAPGSERERVLERFVRLDATRSTSGNGLGLSLVQAVARLHGARLCSATTSPGSRSGWNSRLPRGAGSRRPRPDPALDRLARCEKTAAVPVRAADRALQMRADRRHIAPTEQAGRTARIRPAHDGAGGGPTAPCRRRRCRPSSSGLRQGSRLRRTRGRRCPLCRSSTISALPSSPMWYSPPLNQSVTR